GPWPTRGSPPRGSTRRPPLLAPGSGWRPSSPPSSARPSGCPSPPRPPSPAGAGAPATAGRPPGWRTPTMTSRPARTASPPDTPWQAEMEAAFPYEETPDQARAIDDVKADMERDVPMERLVCGDVGYGKTEVAVRAAFKAVQDGKQVAVLVPTTLLANQH